VYGLETNRRALWTCRRGRLKWLCLDRDHPDTNGDLDITDNAGAFTRAYYSSNINTIAQSYTQPFADTSSNTHACTYVETPTSA
jgi:hypothetical protein